MPRTGYLIAVVTAVIGAVVFPWPAAAVHEPGHVTGDQPYFTCQASVARVTLRDAQPIPPVDPLAANTEREECAEDLGGLPNIALPPAPAPNPVLTTTTGQARTQILCANDDLNPLLTPENNELCDAGRHAFEQQVLATANVEDLQINLGEGANAIQITAEAANTSARARCGAGNVPELSSTSNFVNLVVTVGGRPFQIQLPPANEELEVDLGIAKLTLNELVGTQGTFPSTAAEGVVTRRALHLEVPGGTEPGLGSAADVVVAESTADFHGRVCVRPGPGQVICPPGSVPNAQGQCIINRADCPPGTGRNPQGQCIVLNVQCPAGTTFNPITRGCTEAPRGGVLVPLTPQLQNFFRASPCIGQGFGPLVGILGTNGPDRITGTNRSDRIFALGGNDRVSGGRGDDCVEGGSGRDVLDGSNGNDFLLGGSGNDQVNGGPGRDRFRGGSGRDNLSGGNGNDTMRGDGGRDRLQGGFGNDRLVGGAGNDGIHTGNGRDRVSAGSGNDIINAATVGPPAFVDCGPGRKDRVRINRNEVRRHRNCEFVDVPRRIRSNNRPQSPR